MLHFPSSAPAAVARYSFLPALRRLVLPSLFLAALAGSLPHAAADPVLSVADASALVQSTVTDTDAFFLTGVFGFQSGQTLNYSSTSNSTAWTGTLSGPYRGPSLDVSYTGNLSAYPSGAVTWTDSGTYGSHAWSGSGSAVITGTSATTFDVTFADSLDVGGATASVDGTLPGTVLPDGDVVYGASVDSEVGPVDVLINGHRNKDLYLSYRKKDHELILSDYAFVRVGGRPPRAQGRNDYVIIATPADAATSDEGTFGLSGTITTVPEPASWAFVLAGLGIVGALVRRYRFSFRPAPKAKPET